MVSQNATPSRQVLGGALPYAFTEQGVAAISSAITSERAVEVSIMIMRTFAADLVRSAKHSLTLIDNFIDDTVLTLFLKRKEGVSLQIITQKNSKELLCFPASLSFLISFTLYFSPAPKATENKYTFVFILEAIN